VACRAELVNKTLWRGHSCLPRIPVVSEDVTAGFSNSNEFAATDRYLIHLAACECEPRNSRTTFSIRRIPQSPSAVRIDSGWNCTAATGSVL